MSEFSQVEVAFSQGNLLVLNAILAGMIFGVSLKLTTDDFVRVIRQPRAPAAGLLAQFILLPAITCLGTALAGVEPQLALGMILVASCPGGSFSNVMTWLGKASVPVSVSMTAVSSLAAIVMTPFNFTLYGYLNPMTRPLLREISLDPASLLLLVGLVLVAPLLLGMAIGKRHPVLAERADKPMRIVTLLVFLLFVVIAFAQNLDNIKEYAARILLLVVVHNFTALALGNLAGRLLKLATDERRAVTLEVGIQNTALGLSIIFTFFPEAGGMMLIAGLWSFWHLIAGLTLALIWSRQSSNTGEGQHV
ncbi:BASS family bile acid:Na+ symporter [Litorivivens lipolytica]|uniref:BASS family bile acid:Na+ symporter n=1 Tax=Litorivivens lipolytica TaxID=1524264 RepID=A0A7W4W501_9GAMM|nr:bile acid:sodium symporter family protein [Litorivivens lipolytica]MBB3047591.1 BASS family bile acid:Na+ symporter [Litorivivens lipolytica]